MKTELDHITVTAPDLAAGVEHVRRVLGVAPQPGGEHPLMGTHNCLLRLGDALFLEVIAANPQAPPPARPRWFGLDHPPGVPRLAAWVARTDDVAAAAAASPVPTGRIEAMSRGQASWRITIPEDGSLSMQGVAPALIQWQVPAHPASKLEDRGCTLLRLEGFHPQAGAISAMLRAVGFAGDFAVAVPSAGEGPHLAAHIRTPGGVRVL